MKGSPMLFVFTVRFFLATYGGANVEVVAHNVVEALAAATATEHGWMLLDPRVNLYGVERGMIATCTHEGATARDAEGTVWECDDCPITYGEDHPGSTATHAGFRAYCASIVESGRF